MEAYIYDADILCDDCGAKVREDLRAAGKAPKNEEDEGTYDSDEYPKGSYNDGGGEADCPQHCGMCGVFLENPLTSEGAQYVLDKVMEDVQADRIDSVAVTVWAPYYWDISPEELLEPYFHRFDVCDALCVLSHDFGLYALRTRLTKAGYSPGLSGRGDFFDLSPNAKGLYLRYAGRVVTYGWAYEPRPWKQ